MVVDVDVDVGWICVCVCVLEQRSRLLGKDIQVSQGWTDEDAGATRYNLLGLNHELERDVHYRTDESLASPR